MTFHPGRWRRQYRNHQWVETSGKGRIIRERIKNKGALEICTKSHGVTREDGDHVSKRRLPY